MKRKLYKIGITGHRDLKESCINHYQKKVSSLLSGLKIKYKEVIVYSPLADGADRLIVKEAIKLGISYKAILPMPKELYRMDFDNKSFVEFETLLKQSEEVIILPLCQNISLKQISYYGEERDEQYEAVGHYIVDIVDGLVALWDGKKIGLRGGTGKIVEYYLKTKQNTLYQLLVSRSKDVQNNMVEFKIYNDSS